MRRVALALAVSFLAGCPMYFSSDDDPCPPTADDIAVSPALQVRNPFTGTCEILGGPCDDACGRPCSRTEAIPDWGQCFSECDAILQTDASAEVQEAACIAHPRCRPVYQAFLGRPEAPAFFACWSIAPSGPAPGSCASLDAYECSRHDNCAAVYEGPGEGG